MSLALFSDANRWLDGTKIRFENDNDAEPERLEAESVAKAALIDLYPDHVSHWVTTLSDPPVADEEVVPELVRTIVSLLMAAYRYQRRYSEETQTPSTFAMVLEARATAFLSNLRGGTMSLSDVDYQSELQVGSPDFYPNDDTLVTTESPQTGLSEGDSLRFFTMEATF